jgi:hypothetical protein
MRLKQTYKCKQHKILTYRYFLQVLKIIKNNKTLEEKIEAILYFNNVFNFEKYFKIYYDRFLDRQEPLRSLRKECDVWDKEQREQHDKIEKETGIRPLKWRPTEIKSRG